ncbi:MAG: ribosome recycling factor [Halobacteriovoraceae bacterium]|nr:ribosome recycling factor [Halobacteriovoraceae bacterium]
MEDMESNINISMSKVMDNLKQQLSKIRTGRASSNALDGVMVDYYGNPTPISQVGQISTPEARLLQVKPYDRNMISNIERAILAANLGVTPSNDGNFIRIPFPSLTEETRNQRVKEIKKVGENAKVNIRNCRREQNELVKKALKEKEITEDDLKKHQNKIQGITDRFIEEIDKLINSKEEELLQV